MSCPPGTDSKEIQRGSSAEYGKILQDPQPPRNKQLEETKPSQVPQQLSESCRKQTSETSDGDKDAQ